MSIPRSESDDDFARMLSHQMKAPVNAVRSLLQAVVENRSDEISPAVREALERAIVRAGEAGSLVEDLLEYEYFEAGKIGDSRAFDVIDLLSDLGERFSLAAASKDVAVEISLPEATRAYVQGNRAAIEHALRNLIDNAVKYSPQLGRVMIALAVDPPKKSLRIAIQDSGGGIPAEEMPHLFKPFFRSKTQSATTGGTGLGLAIAQRIVEAHGGRIEVESQAGIGTTFAVTLQAERIERMEQPTIRRRRVVIIGGVTSGPKAAARLRRLDESLDITIIERNEFLSYAGCQLPAYLSGSIGSAQDIRSGAYRIIRTAHFFQAMKNITVLNMTSAERIDRAGKRVIARRRTDGKVIEIGYDVLVLATGSLPVIPSIPGAATDLVLPLHSLEDARRIRERVTLRQAQDVLIIGGGLIGISTIQSLLESGARVTVVEREQTVLSSYFDADFARRIERELEHKGVKLVVGTEISSITRGKAGVHAHADSRSLSPDLIILSSGMEPNSELARACGLKTTATGGIKVDEHLRTSDPAIFAIGDCAETPHLVSHMHEFWPLGSVSLKMGRVAADVIAGREASFHGSLGTVIVQCAGLRIARTGLTQARASQLGYDTVSFIASGAERPGPSLTAGQVHLKVMADRATRRLLGAQAFGTGEVASKISLLASAIAAGMTTDAVFHLDLGHAPEVNLPIEMSQSACLMLNNKIDGLVKTITPEDLGTGGHRTLVAITLPEEGAHFLIPGSMEINPENLRRVRMPFREDEEVVLYSGTSVEAYQAYRYLAQAGFKRVCVLEGGYLFWAAGRGGAGTIMTGDPASPGGH